MMVQMVNRRKKPPMKFWVPVIVIEALVVYALLQALIFCIPAD